MPVMDQLKKTREASSTMANNLRNLIKEGADFELIEEQMDHYAAAVSDYAIAKKQHEVRMKNVHQWEPVGDYEEPLNIAGAVRAIANRERIPDNMARLDEEGRAEAKAMGVNVDNNSNSFFIPARALNQTGVFNSISTDPASGGDAIQTGFGGYITALRDATVLGQLGATFLPTVQGRLSFPAEGDTASASWLAETAEIAKSNPTVGEKLLSAKRLGSYIEVNNKLLAQTDETFQRLLMQQMINAAAEKLDHAGLWGGESEGPVGIGSDSDVPVLFAGEAADDTVNADGAALTRGDLINMMKTLSANNAMRGNIGFATNAAVRAALQSTPVISGSDQFVWDAGQPENLMGYNAGVTNLIPSTLSKGSSNALSALILGNFEDVIIGMWGGIQILTDPYTLSRSGKTAMVINHFADVLVRRSSSFVVIKDIIA